MIKETMIDLNIKKTAGITHHMRKNLINTGTSVLLLLFFLYLRDDSPTFQGSFLHILTIVGIIGAGIATLINLILFIRELIKYNKLSKKENDQPEKEASFTTAKRDMKGLVVSEEIVDGFRNKSLLLDHENRNLNYITISKVSPHKFVKYKTIPYSKISQAGVVIDEELITKSSLGSKVGGYIVGGLLGGTPGAIIGGINTKRKTMSNVSKIELRIAVDDKKSPLIIFQLNGKELDDSGRINRLKDRAEEWVSIINNIIKEEKEEMEAQENKESTSPGQEESLPTSIKSTNIENSGNKIQMLRDLEALKANKTINEDEFNKMKEEIINN